LIPYFLLTVCVLSLDRITKFIVLSKISVGESVPVIKGIFHITLVLNKGVAFGLFANNTLVPKTISVFAIFAILVFFLKYSKRAGYLTKTALSLILAGCIGNLVDRLYLGTVIDFLDFRIWPVFNMADSVICIGVGLLILGFIRGNKKET